MTLPCIRPPPRRSSFRKHSAMISWRTSRGCPGTPKSERSGRRQANHRYPPAAAPWGIGTPQSAGGPCRPVTGENSPLPCGRDRASSSALHTPRRTAPSGVGAVQQRQPAGPGGQYLWGGGYVHDRGNDSSGPGGLERSKREMVTKPGGEHPPTPASLPSTSWKGRCSTPSTRKNPAAGRMRKTSAPSWARP